MTLALLMNSLTMTKPSPRPVNASGTKSVALFLARVNSMGYRLRPSLYNPNYIFMTATQMLVAVTEIWPRSCYQENIRSPKEGESLRQANLSVGPLLEIYNVAASIAGAILLIQSINSDLHIVLCLDIVLSAFTSTDSCVCMCFSQYRKILNCFSQYVPIMAKINFPNHFSFSPKNWSIAISLRGIPFNLSNRSIPVKINERDWFQELVISQTHDHGRSYLPRLFCLEIFAARALFQRMLCPL